MTSATVHARASPLVQGLTLIEILVVIAIVALLGLLATPGLLSVASNQALSNAASDLMFSMLQARSTALKENRPAIVRPIIPDDWQSGWRVYIDMNRNDAYDQDDDKLLLSRPALGRDIVVSQHSDSQGNSSGMAVVAYGSDGFPRSRAGTIVLQSSTTGREKHVIVSRTGRVRVCAPNTSGNCPSS